jgi:hypothetical protein
MRRALAVVIGCLCLVFVLTASAAPAQRREDCTWGASSVVVEDVNGKLVQSEPETSGCIPH